LAAIPGQWRTVKSITATARHTFELKHGWMGRLQSLQRRDYSSPEYQGEPNPLTDKYECATQTPRSRNFGIDLHLPVTGSDPWAILNIDSSFDGGDFSDLVWYGVDEHRPLR
jgi:hypothetical protein